MPELNLEEGIKSEFLISEENKVPDEFIISNPDVLWLEKEIDYMIYIPSYILWCLKNRDSDGNLVCDRTRSALAELGRAKDLTNHLNFKFLCNNKQKELIFHFLNWCLSNLLWCQKEQITRAIKNWR
jgi:hypothetical protein